jgi:hypothetical protein
MKKKFDNGKVFSQNSSLIDLFITQALKEEVKKK